MQTILIIAPQNGKIASVPHYTMNYRAYYKKVWSRINKTSQLEVISENNMLQACQVKHQLVLLSLITKH